MPKKYLGSVVMAFVALLILTACQSTQAQVRAGSDAYIRAHISEMSPRKPTLGGTFMVTDIQWMDDGTVLVTYEDGHIQLKGTTTVTVGDGEIAATRINLE